MAMLYPTESLRLRPDSKIARLAHFRYLLCLLALWSSPRKRNAKHGTDFSSTAKLWLVVLILHPPKPFKLRHHPDPNIPTDGSRLIRRQLRPKRRETYQRPRQDRQLRRRQRRHRVQHWGLEFFTQLLRETIDDLALTFEIRSWKTDYRGRIALHASSGTAADALDRGADEDVWAECFALAGLVTKADVKALRRSAIIGTIEIQEIGTLDDLEDSMSDAELDLFGDLGEDVYLWRMTNPVPIEPLSIDGKLNLWTLPDELASEVVRRESMARVQPVGAVTLDAVERARATWKAVRVKREADIEALMAAPVRLTGPLCEFIGAEHSSRAEIYEKLEGRCASLPATDDGRVVMDSELRTIVGGRNKYMTLHDIAMASIRWIESDER